MATHDVSTIGPAPPLPAFRVGITGTRRALDPATQERVTLQIGELLDCVAATLPGNASLRALSPLAEGADRLLAEAALARGWHLVAPLPFPPKDYKADFPATQEAFQSLLDRAEPLIVDGGRDSANASYEAAGRFVVRNCDVLIAIWDGHTKNGRGGTAEIMRFAARAEVPIWWLNPDAPTPPLLIRRSAELAYPPHAPTDAPSGIKAEAELRALVARTLTRPAAPPPDRAGLIGHLVSGFCRMAGRPDDPLTDYLAETTRPDRLVWRLYSGLMGGIAPGHLPAGPTHLKPEGPVEEYWAQLHDPADQLSNAYGDRYRSCYLWVFLLATLAVVSAVLGLAFPATLEDNTTPAEFVFLLGIAGVVGTNHLRRFHERWISYRLLAELCRKQQVLARLGWSLPHWEVERLTRDEAQETVGPPRETWVAWYFSAMCRAAPMLSGQIGQAEVQRARDLGRSLAAEQISYHRDRERRSERAGHWLVTASEMTFGLTLLLVFIRFLIVLPLSTPASAEGLAARLLGVGCLIMPALSAGFVGIRAYAEFEVLAHQSARMRREITELAETLEHPMGSEPLESQRVAAQLMALTMAMLRELRGWAQLFRVKPVESG